MQLCVHAQWNWLFFLQEIELSDEEKSYVMDLKPYYNPSPYTVEQKFSLPRVFNLFRGLGLRHLIVTDEKNVVSP